MARRVAVLLAVVFAMLLSITVTPAAHAESYLAAAGVESKYARPGPWTVTAQHAFTCCDSTGAAFDIWYPAELGAGGFRHPIISWGDGTNAHPEQYDYLLRQLASWGFVVIATESSQTGSGADIVGAVERLVALAADPGSVFHGRLDAEKVGAVGHSQGASGALNAMLRPGSRISTVVPIELPMQVLCGTGSWCPDTGRLTAGSVFLINGSEDVFISPSEQGLPAQVVGLQSVRAYYEAIPAGIPKVWGTLVGPNHNDVQGQPDCARASFPCTTGVYGYLGYPTAWLAARLLDAADARQAFEPGGEFYAPNPQWVNQIGSLG
ncbi:poly(ethylene terephthalate) hydrolase family protein [Nocardia inohanensis]|uniref:poly(ethylene terephthalate) hydrolase family protein n=1 Tax=Nocardia inohanensis TaxID=209246 RepID=UPI00082EF483|nr:alpha/beta hydrolase [Nocardia inohanensis]